MRAVRDRASRSDPLRVVAAAGLGAGAVATGFAPFNTAADVLSVADRPWAVVFLPTVMLAIGSVVAAILFPSDSPRRLPRALLLGIALLVLGGVLSLGASPERTDSLVLLIQGVLAPVVFAVALLKSNLPRTVLCAAFLAATAAFLLRADAVFLLQNGLPSPDTLFEAKFRREPYDFHYYTLNNPNYSSAFLVLPLALSAFWAASPSIDRRARWALLSLVALIFAHIVLVYVRATIVVAFLVLVGALLAAPLSRRARRWCFGAVGLIALAFVSKGGIWTYFAGLLDQSPSASGVVRLASIRDGFLTFLNHPLSGVGLGQYGINQGLDPAHSSLVQAGAETGVAGLAGTAVLTAAGTSLAWIVARAEGWRGLRAAGALAAATFCVQSAVTAGPPWWLASYSNAIWGLSLGLVAAGAFAGADTERGTQWLTDWLSRVAGKSALLAHRVRRKLEAPGWAWLRNTRVLLVAYGGVAGLLALLYVSARLPAAAELLPSRLESLRGAFDALEQGRPPLTQVDAIAGTYTTIERDLGVHLFVPLVSQVVGAGGPQEGLRWLIAGCFAATAALYPLVWWRVLGSAPVALASPLLLLGFSFLLELLDLSWVPAWAILTCLPAILALYRRWSRRSIASLAAVMVAASFASSLRPAAGASVLLSGLLVILLRERRFTRRLAYVAVVLVAYASVSPLLVAGLELHRDSRVGEGSPPLTAQHPEGSATELRAAAWQGAYFGLGWYGDVRGIDYMSDPANPSSGASAPYLGEDEIDALKSEVSTVVARDPAAFAWNTLRKAFSTVVEALARFSLILVALPAVLLLARDWRRPLAGCLLVVSPALVISLAAPAVAYPLPHYVNGFLAAVGVVWLLSVSTALVLVERAVRAARGTRRAGGVDLEDGSLTLPFEGGRRAAVVLTAGAIALIAVTSFPAKRLTDNPHAFYASAKSVPLGTYANADGDVRTWSFERGLPEGWRAINDPRLETTGPGLRVRTGEGIHDQLVAPVQRLSPGTYDMFVKARIDRGGLIIAAADERTQQWLRSANYYFDQSRDGLITGGFTMTLRAPTAIRLTLTNWSADEGSSTWTIQKAGILAAVSRRELARRSAPGAREGAVGSLIDSTVAAQRRP